MPLTINTDIATVATGSTAPGSATLIGGFNGVLLQPVSVKAASTAAVATDPALVVAVSPNNSLIMSGTVQQLGGDLFTAGALGALSASVTVPAAGFQSVGFHMDNGTFRGTIAPEISIDNGVNWVSTFWETPNTGAKTSILAIAANYAPVERTIIVPGGVSHARVRVTAYTSGTANAIIRATQLGRDVISSESATGSAIPKTALMVGGTDATNLRALLVDTSGRQVVVGAGASTGALTGNPVAVAGSIVDGASISTHRGTMIGTKGSDGLYHHVVSDPLGNVKMIMSPTASSIHSSSVVTSSSNSGAISAFGARCISLYYTVSSATPSGGTMTYTVEELSADVTTVIRSSSKTFSTTGSGVVHLGSVNSYYIRVSWTLTGGAPSYTVTSSIYASSNVGSMNEGAPGDAIPLQTALVGGTDLGTLRSIAVNTSGAVRQAEGGIVSYSAAFSDTTGTSTTGSATAMVLWHASANTTPVYIRKIIITTAAGSGSIPEGNSIVWSVGWITADGGSGTTITAAPMDRADSASTLTGANGAIRSLPTAPTALASTSNIAEWIQGGAPARFVWDATREGKPIELRASTAEGIQIKWTVAGTLTLGSLYSITVQWTEGTAITLGYM